MRCVNHKSLASVLEQLQLVANGLVETGLFSQVRVQVVRRVAVPVVPTIGKRQKTGLNWTFFNTLAKITQSYVIKCKWVPVISDLSTAWILFWLLLP